MLNCIVLEKYFLKSTPKRDIWKTTHLPFEESEFIARPAFENCALRKRENAQNILKIFDMS